MIALKAGVRLHGIRPEIVMAVLIAERIWDEQSETLVITSVIDGSHMRASIHYTGGAIDFRLPHDRFSRAVQQLAESLGADFDVVPEDDHVHVEWQPKAGYFEHADS